MYDKRAASYHEVGSTGFHGSLRDLLLSEAPPREGSAVVDMCAGTGIVSLAVAEAVGSDGVVVAVDFAEQMVAEGRRVAANAGLTERVHFLVGDAEEASTVSSALAVSGRSAFDAVYCSAAAVWFDSLPKALVTWRQSLRPGGIVAFNGWSESSFVAGAILQEVAWSRGWDQVANWHGLTATPAKCKALLEGAGYSDPRVLVTDMSNKVMVASELKSGFGKLLAGTPSKLENSPYLQNCFTDAQQEELRVAYCRRVDEMANVHGVVRDRIVTHTIVGRVPES